MGDWCLIESDPGVLSELLHSVGCEDVSMEEVYMTEQLLGPDWHYNPDNDTFGLVFLFKYQRSASPSSDQDMFNDDGQIFFAQQVIQNACASSFTSRLRL
jgi:ubiquitin carboxyl-terminal hydrolase L5